MSRAVYGATDRQESPVILEYYREEEHSKIDHRKELAQQLGIALNALRIQACRIRASLQECVFECLKQAEASAARAPA